MNIDKVTQLRKLYKQHFQSIHHEEIYKWRAVKCFQDNWNIDAVDFTGMLGRSFSQTGNLLHSGNYYAHKMLTKNTEHNPEFIRLLFKALYEERQDLVSRIISFQDKFKQHSQVAFPELYNAYQDQRAVMVYLSLRYPDRYFFFKFEMFKDFVARIDYPYTPIAGRIDNVLQFINLCQLLKSEVEKDGELLKLHKTRLTDGEFDDTSFNILTQDLIYAAVRHIDKFETSGSQLPAMDRLREVDYVATPTIDEPVLKGKFKNYIENQKENKRIGDLGELVVLQYEIERLKKAGIKKIPEHTSKKKGDGLGYDILSYNEKGEEIFIEVKTTTGAKETPFYITRNEHICSQQIDESYFIYRLFEYDDKLSAAQFYIRQGSLDELCINPILYKVKI